MNKDIEAIFLDHGNTLRVVVEDEEFASQARQGLLTLIDPTDSEEVFFAKLDERWKTYRKWSIECMVEASERELWTTYLLPDFPAKKIGPLAGRLTRLWRDKDGRRLPPPDVKPVIHELDRRGYILGIIANTITESEIPDWLEQDGLAQYFKTVVLSSKLKIKKPNPEIFWEASRQIGVEPARCVYVGDNPKRDVLGTRHAGFGGVILLMSPEKLAKEPPEGENIPDHLIQRCSELLDLFPPRARA